MDAPDTHNGQRQRTNERTDGRRDAPLRSSVRPFVRLLDGVRHLGIKQVSRCREADETIWKK